MKTSLGSLVFAVLASTLLMGQHACAADVEFDENSGAWRITLENDDVKTLRDTSKVVLAGNPDPSVSKAIVAGVLIIDLTNEIGGRKGVEITGNIISMAIVVTPKGSSIGVYDKMKKGGKEVKKLKDHWVGVAKSNVEKIDDFLVKNDPGPAISRLVGGGRKKDVRVGGMGAKTDKDEVEFDQSWERCIIITHPDGKVSLRYFTGFLQADNGGGGSAYADSTEMNDNSKWTVVKNDDGSISLKSAKGFYFFAHDGGGAHCGADREKIGGWEKFTIHYNNDGTAHLTTKEKGKIVQAERP